MSPNILSSFLSFLILQLVSSSSYSAKINLLGDECTSNSTCSIGNIDNSYCFVWEGHRSGSCQCMSNYTASHDLKRCLPENLRIGAFCEESVQCTGHSEGKSVCLPGSGICECSSGYIQNKDMSECLVKINTLGTRQCTEDVQCQLGKPGRLSFCGVKFQGPFYTGEKVCKCKQEAVDGIGSNANRCHKKAKNFGDSCKFQAQCTSTLQNAICMGGKCEKHPAFDAWRARGGGKKKVTVNKL